MDDTGGGLTELLPPFSSKQHVFEKLQVFYCTLNFEPINNVHL